MNYQFTIQLIGANDNVLVTETISSNISNWKSPLKAEITRLENKYIELDWKKFSIIVERI